MEDQKEDLYYQRLNNFLANDCEFVPTEKIKGKFLYNSFIETNSDSAKLDLKGFYDLMRTWIEKTIESKIDEVKLSKVVYFQGLRVKGKSDKSIQEYNDKSNIRSKNYRQRKADEENRIIIPRHRRTNIIKKNYNLNESLPVEVIEWDQHKVTIDNFEQWYQSFLVGKNKDDPAESMEILNFALNNFRHARDINPKQFRSTNYDVLIHHVEHQLELLDNEISDRINIKKAIGITNKSRNDVIEELKSEMYKILTVDHFKFFESQIPISKPKEIKQWLSTTFMNENPEKIKFREEVFEEILLDENIKRNRYL